LDQIVMANISKSKSGAAPRRLALLMVSGVLIGLSSPLGAQSVKSVPTAEELLDALRGKVTRGVTSPVTPVNAAKEEQRVQLIDQLKAKALRGLSNGSASASGATGSSAPVTSAAGGSVLTATERTQLAEAVKDQPSVNIEVPFAFNSAEIAPNAISALTSLGKALQDGSIKSSDMLLAGHTDAKGRPEYNQTLSQRRADAVREYLVKNFSISSDKLVSVGYGREKLKDPGHPYAEANRRVQVVNLTASPTAAAAVAKP
jgi:outer membrane protein OmpA-like peptidoglycan-associated protein